MRKEEENEEREEIIKNKREDNKKMNIDENKSSIHASICVGPRLPLSCFWSTFGDTPRLCQSTHFLQNLWLIDGLSKKLTVL